MEPHDELDQQLWEFVYELLPEHEAQRLRDRITSDPEVARAYVRVKLRSELLAEAAKHEGPPVVLRPPDEAIVERSQSLAGPRDSRRRPRIVRAANWIVGVAAAGLVCVIGYGLLQPAFTSLAPSAAAPPSPVLAKVSVPPQVIPDTTNYFFVQTNSLRGEPQSTEVSYRFLDARGEIKLAGTATTDAQGGLPIVLPRSLSRSAAGLEVTPVTAGREEPIRAKLQQAEPRPVAFLSLDGAEYRPGGTVRCRFVTLSPFEFLSDQEMVVEFDALGSNQQSILPSVWHNSTQRGVASGAVDLPADLTAGTYTLAVRSPDREYAPVERDFVVGPAEPQPPLQEHLEPAATEPAATEPPARAVRELDVEFFPEGGALVSDLENRVYFTARDAQRQPVEIAGRVVAEENLEVVQVRTARAGRGVFSLTPQAARTYALEILEPSDVVQRLSMPPVAAEAKVLLRVEPCIVPAGSPLEVQLQANRPLDQLVVAAYCREALVGQQLIDATRFSAAGAGFQCTVSLPLASEAAGVLRVVVFEYQPGDPTVVAQRVVFCRPQQQIELQVRPAERTELSDAGRGVMPVRLEVLANDERGRPVPAVIGALVTAADGASPAVPDELSLPSYYYLASALDRPEDAQELRFCLSNEPGADTALDLLLGTQGWGGLPSAPGDVLLADMKAGKPVADTSRGRNLSGMGLAFSRQSGALDLGERRVADAGRGQPPAAPVILDNAAEVQHAVTPALPVGERHAVDRLRIGRVLVAGASAVGTVALILGLLGLCARVRYLVPVLATACVSLVIGLIWMAPREAWKEQLAMGRPEGLSRSAPSERVADRDAAVAARVEESAEQLTAMGQVARSDAAYPEAQPAAEAEGQQIAGATPVPKAAADFLATPPAAPRPAPPALEAVQESIGYGAVGGGTLRRSAAAPAQAMPARGALSEDLAPQPAASSVAPPPAGMGGGYGQVGDQPLPEPASAAATMKAPAPETKDAELGRSATRVLEMAAAGEDKGKLLETPASQPLYWNPLLVADEQGRVLIELPPLPTQTALRVVLNAHAAGRLGALDTRLEILPPESPSPAKP